MLRMANDEAVKQRQEQAMRRMLNLQLASGFSAWRALADERRRLMHATRNLRSPGLACGWRSWLEMVEHRRGLRSVLASFRSPSISQAFRIWRRLAVAGMRLQEQRRREAERRFAELQRQCESLKQFFEARDTQTADARRRLDEALAIGWTRPSP